MKPLLLCLMLGGCHYMPGTPSCVWGGATPAEDAVCAEKNFGRAAADEATLRRAECRARECGTEFELVEDAAFCAVNCR